MTGMMVEGLRLRGRLTRKIKSRSMLHQGQGQRRNRHHIMLLGLHRRGPHKCIVEQDRMRKGTESGMLVRLLKLVRLKTQARSEGVMNGERKVGAVDGGQSR